MLTRNREMQQLSYISSQNVYALRHPGDVSFRMTNVRLRRFFRLVTSSVGGRCLQNSVYRLRIMVGSILVFCGHRHEFSVSAAVSFLQYRMQTCYSVWAKSKQVHTSKDRRGWKLLLVKDTLQVSATWPTFQKSLPSSSSPSLNKR
jgi:hypothetical protein